MRVLVFFMRQILYSDTAMANNETKATFGRHMLDLDLVELKGDWTDMKKSVLWDKANSSWRNMVC